MEPDLSAVCIFHNTECLCEFLFRVTPGAAGTFLFVVRAVILPGTRLQAQVKTKPLASLTPEQRRLWPQSIVMRAPKQQNAVGLMGLPAPLVTSLQRVPASLMKGSCTCGISKVLLSRKKADSVCSVIVRDAFPRLCAYSACASVCTSDA